MFWSIFWDKSRLFRASTAAEAEQWVQVSRRRPPPPDLTVGVRVCTL
jgi:hypothetical protein